MLTQKKHVATSHSAADSDCPGICAPLGWRRDEIYMQGGKMNHSLSGGSVD